MTHYDYVSTYNVRFIIILSRKQWISKSKRKIRIPRKEWAKEQRVENSTCFSGWFCTEQYKNNIYKHNCFFAPMKITATTTKATEWIIFLFTARTVMYLLLPYTILIWTRDGIRSKEELIKTNGISSSTYRPFVLINGFHFFSFCCHPFNVGHKYLQAIVPSPIAISTMPIHTVRATDCLLPSLIDMN